MARRVKTRLGFTVVNARARASVRVAAPLQTRATGRPRTVTRGCQIDQRASLRRAAERLADMHTAAATSLLLFDLRSDAITR